MIIFIVNFIEEKKNNKYRLIFDLDDLTFEDKSIRCKI